MATHTEDQRISSNVTGPLIHKVATEQGKYIYDVNTGEILRVDHVIWEIVDDSYLSEGAVIAKYTSHFTRDQIAEAYREISVARAEDGYFLNDHPTVGVPVSREQVHRAVACERKILVLEVTEQCNFLCTYCRRNMPISGVARPGTRDMNWETARAAIDDFLGHCCAGQRENQHSSATVPHPGGTHNFVDDSVHIVFTGGEPLLNFPLIKKCTEYARERAKGRVRFGMTTNGYLLEGDKAEFLGAHNFRIMVSLDGPASLHDGNRRTKTGMPTHHIVMDHLRAFVRKYPRQAGAINAVIARGTDAHEVYRYFASADWIPPTTDIGMGLASPPYPGYFPSSPGTDEFPGFREMYEEFKENLVKGRISRDVESRELDLLRGRFTDHFKGLHRHRWRVAHWRRDSRPCAPPGPCLGGALRTHVSVTGVYSLCERVLPREMYQIGSVTTGMDEERVYHLLHEFVECSRQECERCWCLGFCAAGCHASVADRDGFSVDAKRRACEDARGLLHQSLEDYCSILERNPRAFDFLNVQLAST